jgi:hypothetical protein
VANTLGGWAFLVGVVLALVFAFFGQFASWAWLLVVLGLLIGFLNISEKETQKFLMAGAVLVIVGEFGGNAFGSVMYLSGIFNNLVALFAPATIVVALKSVFEMAKK